MRAPGALARAVIVARVCAAVLLPAAFVCAQTAYKYRDADGHWVFTDQAAPADTPGQAIALTRENAVLHIAIERVEDAHSVRLDAVNECLCVVTFHVEVGQSGIAGIPAGAVFDVTAAPSSRRTLVQGIRPAADTALRYDWKAAIGSPDAVHAPGVPYRVPFAVGSTHVVSQAFPSRVTHTTADSEYAVDIVMPDNTPVYAAREGTVINARHDAFRGAATAALRDQANVIEILQPDGTVAVYAHLHWDSLRVRIGAHVARGEYLADAGDTGYATGPHLHFAVVRNTGAEDVSVPVQFAGAGGAAVTARTREPLTAY